MMNILLTKFEDYLEMMIVPDLDQGSMVYSSAFFAGGLRTTLFAWIRRNFRETPSELADVVLKYESIRLFRNIPE